MQLRTLHASCGCMQCQKHTISTKACTASQQVAGGLGCPPSCATICASVGFSAMELDWACAPSGHSMRISDESACVVGLSQS